MKKTNLQKIAAPALKYLPPMILALIFALSLFFIMRASASRGFGSDSSAESADVGESQGPGEEKPPDRELGEIKAIANIYLEGELFLTFPLRRGQERTFSLKEKPGVRFRLFPDASAAFSSSDCPDQICVNTGRIALPGAFAACLPNGLVLTIVAYEEKDYAETPELDPEKIEYLK